MGNYGVMKDYAEKVLGIGLEDIFPVLPQVREAEKAGRDLKPEEIKPGTKMWDYDILVRARAFFKEIADSYQGLEGNAEADELWEKCTAHLEKLNTEWDRVGIFK